jgi:hypothetical protein
MVAAFAPGQPGSGTCRWKICQRDDGQPGEQEEGAGVADGAEQGEKLTVTMTFAPQLAMVATLIACPRIFTG